ncbi:hypothetical protein PoB_000064400 [Plakobranchus ocellatus]|uniref:Peptidase A1 domain-containing protein n=1 Tax=Plakobranchus ocellatus TaxID=259542 RepID=A0AAV3XWK1_9GAST|nr:hypothetical protein PoB_000064400 [Plakobranchus ocellatus]
MDLFLAAALILVSLVSSSYATEIINIPLSSFKDLERRHKRHVGNFQKFRLGAAPADIAINSFKVGGLYSFQRQKNHKQYNSTLSRTYTDDGESFSITYGIGTAAGYLSEDCVMVAGLSVKDQIFGEAIDVSDNFEDSYADGILGMGFRTISAAQQLTVFDNMVEQKVVPAPIFSFYLKSQRSESGGSGSVLTLGGTNPQHYTGNFTFVDVTEPTFWQFKLDSVNIAKGAGTFCKHGCNAIVDSGTSLIVGPIKETNQLNRLLGGRPVPFPPGLFEFDCQKINNMPDVEFTVNGKTLSFSSKEYVIKLHMVCLSSFSGTKYPPEKEPSWIIGTPFMQAYYTQFDKENNRIGFAKARH